MPNHVTNYVTFGGSDAKIAELLSKVKSKDSDFDFKTFAPMPDELIGSRSPSNIVSQQEYDKWVMNCDKDSVKFNWEQCITQQMSDDMKKKYGADNWYDWSINNWGTKWNAYEIYVVDDQVEFQTAWSTPFRAMVKLSEAFPDVVISVRYYDEDFGANVGEYELRNGQLEDENVPDNGSEEAYRLAIDIGGGDYHFSDALVDATYEYDIFDTYYSTCIKLNHEKDYPFDDFPKKVLDKLLEYAVRDENYERANKIKQELNNTKSGDTTIKNCN
jgi:hypothetical protein